MATAGADSAGFAGHFEHLSATYRGDVFAMSSSLQRDVPVGRFRLHTAPTGSNALEQAAAWLRLQVGLPRRVLGRERADAIITYDPYASGVAGVLLTPLQSVSFDSDVGIAINGFAAAIFGGLLRPGTALAGGLLLGIAEALVAGYSKASYESGVALVLILGIMVWQATRRPEGAE